MGWEPLDKHCENDEVIGDEPFDEMAESIEKIAMHYKESFDRKPTVNELVTTFKQALETRISDVTIEGEDHELISIKYKLKKNTQKAKI